MGAKSDQVKGHAKEVAGIIASDEDLQSKGKADRVAGEAQAQIDRARGKVVEMIDKVEETFDGVMEKAKDVVKPK